MVFEVAVSATRGERAYQEDAAVFWPGPATFALDLPLPEPAAGSLHAILADGMGGHAGGQMASRTACRSFLSAISGLTDLDEFRTETTESTVPLGTEDGFAARETTLTRPPRPRRAREDDLTAALLAANTEIAGVAALDPRLTGMGTTLVALAMTAQSLEWISVGDSPLYLYRAGDLALLNEDHSLAPALDQLVLEGRITAEAARNDPRRHMLRSALTGDDLDLIDRSRKPLTLVPDDVVILASDGIHTLDEDEIARIVTAYRGDGADAVAKALVRAVENQRVPHQDNATIMVIVDAA